jgi:RHS repeat-associated protein
MQRRVIRLHKWVFNLVRRWFPWMFRVRQRPIRHEAEAPLDDLRHRPSFLELERRKAPTSLSVAGVLAPPVALLAGLAQRHANEGAQASTLERVERGDNTLGEPRESSPTQLIRGIVSFDSSPGTDEKDDSAATVSSATPEDSLRPLGNDPLSENYLQDLAQPDGPFVDVVNADTLPTSERGHNPRTGEADNFHGEGGGGGGGGGGGNGGSSSPSANEEVAFGGHGDQNVNELSQALTNQQMNTPATANTSGILNPPAPFNVNSLGSAYLQTVSQDVSARNFFASPTVPSEVTGTAAQNLPGVTENLPSSPLSFQLNSGNIDPAIQFFTNDSGYHLFLTSHAATLLLGNQSAAPMSPASVGPDAVSMQFVGANANSQMVGLNPAQRTSSFGQVDYQNIYSGVNLEFYGTPQGQLEYDWRLAPGADVNQIQVLMQGVNYLSIDGRGDLYASTPHGEVVQHAPVIYQVINGVRHDVTGSFVLNGPQQVVGFRLGAYDHAHELIIDPLVISGTKFNDLNGDGIQQSNEPLLSGFTMQLYTVTNGQLSASPLQTTTTDSKGYYSFNGLPALPTGTQYAVFEVVPTGWQQTAPQPNPPVTYSLPNGQQGYLVTGAGGVQMATPNGPILLNGPGYLTVNGFNNNTGATVHFVLSGGANETINTLLTQFTATYQGVTFNTFCCDLSHNVSSGQTYLVNPRADLSTAFTHGSEIADIYQTLGQVDLTNDPIEAAAIQVVIWDFIADHDPTFVQLDGTQLDSGDPGIFYADLGGNSASQQIADRANQILQMALGASTQGGWFDASPSGDSQNRGQSLLLPLPWYNFGNKSTRWDLTTRTTQPNPYQGYTTNFGESQVDVNAGALLLSQQINIACSENGRIWDSPTAIYNSFNINNRPIFNSILTTLASDPLPTSIVATLTIDNVAQTPVAFSTSGHSPGDSYLLSVQAASALATGIHSWQLDLQINLPVGGPVLRSTSGEVAVVDRTNSVFGAGWWLSDIDQLVQDPVTHEVEWITGNGFSRIFTFNGTGQPFGNPTGEFGTLVQNGDGSFTYTSKNQIVWQFSSLGLLLSKTDPHGLQERFSYDSGNGNRPTQIVNIDTAVTNISYGIDGKVSVITEQSGHTVTFVHTGLDLTSLTDEDGDLRTFQYNDAVVAHLLTSDICHPWSTIFAYDTGVGSTMSGRLTTVNLGGTSIYRIVPKEIQGLPTGGSAASASQFVATVTDGLNLTTTYQLDFQSRLLELIRADGCFATWLLNVHGQVVQYTDFLGLKTIYDYDLTSTGKGDLTEIDYADNTSESYQYESTFHQLTSFTDRLGLTTTYGVDPSNGDTTRVTSPLGDSSTMVYSQGLLTQFTDCLTHVTQYFYGPCRELTMVIDPLGRTTTTSYDGAGFERTLVDPLGRTTTTFYSGRGFLTESIDACGNTSLTFYDCYGDVTETVDANGCTSLTFYDTTGFATETIDGIGHTNFFLHDADDRVTETIDGNGVASFAFYDTAGNQTETIDGVGNASFAFFDCDGRLTETIDCRGNSAVSFYDTNGNVTETVDALGRTYQTSYDADQRVTETVDALGRTYQNFYDAKGRLTATVDALNCSTLYFYDCYDELTLVIDVLGHSTTTAYDALGNATQTVDALGRTTTTYFDADSEATVVVDPLGRSTLTMYDPCGDVTATVDPLGCTTQTFYDGDHQATEVIDPLGRSTITKYDCDGDVTDTIDPLGCSTLTYYDGDDRATLVVDPLGRSTVTKYDGDGDVTETIDPLNRSTLTFYDCVQNPTETIDPLGCSTITQYDADNEATDVTDPLGRSTTTMFDADGEATKVTDPLGRMTQTLYDADGNVTQTIDALGGTTITLYDCAGKATLTIDCLGRSTLTKYDAHGEVTDTIDALGRSSFTLFDADGETTQTIDPLGRSRETAYDANGQATETTDALGGTAVTLYDCDGEATETIDCLGRSTLTFYDADGNATETIDPMGRSILTFYDCDGEATKVTDPLGRNTLTYFDPDGEMTATVDRLGRSTLTSYDAEGDATLTVDPLGCSTMTKFDCDGEATDVIDPLGRSTLTLFDADGETTAVVDPLGCSTLTVYDPNGQATETIDALGRIRVTKFDCAGRTTAVIDALGRSTLTFYDADDEATAVIDPLGRSTLTLFDADGETTQTIDPLGRSTETLYDADGDATETIDPLGCPTVTKFDCDREATEVIDPLGRSTLTYFDADGELTATVDPLGRSTLTSFDADGGTTLVTDPLGRTTATRFDADGETTATFDPLGRSTLTYYDANGDATLTVDPLGCSTLTRYDCDRELTATIDPLGRSNLTFYDANGQATDTVDPLGRSTVTKFDCDGEVTQVIDPLGRASQTLLDADGETTDTVDPLGRSTLAFYDADGETTATVDPLGRTSLTLFDKGGETTQTIDPLSRSTETLYDANGNATATIDPLGRSTVTLFDCDGETTEVIDPRGCSTLSIYDADGEVTATVDGLSNTTTLLFDADGETTAVIDPLRHTITSSFDADGEVTASIDALGRTAQTIYDANGEAIKTIDNLGKTTTNAFDCDGEVTAVIDPLGISTLSFYDAAGEVTATVDGLGKTTITLYDKVGEVTETIDPLGRSTLVVFDAAGEATATVDALDKTAFTLYDKAGEVTKTIDRAGRSYFTIYDADGEVTATVDGLSNTTLTQFDADGEVTQTIDALGHHTKRFYDADGDLAAVVDAGNNTTTSIYDCDDRVTAVIDPFGKTSLTVYDAAGEVTETIDRAGRSEVSTYDADRHLLTQKWYSSTGTLSNTLSFSWDADGRMLSAGDNAGTVTFTRDADGRVLTEVDPFGVTLTSSYDADSHRTQVRDSLGMGSTAMSLYDAAGNLTSIALAGAGLTGISVQTAYTADNQLSSTTRVAGGSTIGTSAYVYDTSGLITDIQHKKGGSTLAHFSYQYNADGNVTLTSENGSALMSGTATSNYGYDATDQLTSQVTSQVTSTATTNYGWDATGNPINAGDVVGPGNQLLSDGTWNYGYDANGNLITKTGISNGLAWTFGYDNANHLISAVEKQGAKTLVNETMKYDAVGDRIELDSPSVLRFAVDTAGPGGPEVWADLNGTLVTRYLHGNVEDQLLARETSTGTVAFYLTDHLGSVRVITNGTNGNAIDTIAYDAWGTITSESSASNTGRFTFAGREFDKPSGILDERARQLLPSIFRFMEQDPIGFGAGDVNPYRYAGNNPVNRTDPSGKEAQRDFSRLSNAELEKELNYYREAFRGTAEKDKPLLLKAMAEVTAELRRRGATEHTGLMSTQAAINFRIRQIDIINDKIEELIRSKGILNARDIDNQIARLKDQRYLWQNGTDLAITAEGALFPVTARGKQLLANYENYAARLEEIKQMSAADRLGDVFSRVLGTGPYRSKLNETLIANLEAFKEPANLAKFAAIFALAAGVGAIAPPVGIALGYILLGNEVAEIGGKLAAGILIALTAKTDRDLDDAASAIADALSQFAFDVATYGAGKIVGKTVKAVIKKRLDVVEERAKTAQSSKPAVEPPVVEPAPAPVREIRPTEIQGSQRSLRTREILTEAEQAEFKRLLGERAKQQAAKEAADVAKDRKAWAEAHDKLGNVGEEVGNAGAKAAIPREFPGAKLEYQGQGTGTFDQVWKVGDKILVVEAKGGGSRIERAFRTLPDGTKVFQGTREYALEIIRVMKQTGGRAEEIALEVEKSLANGKLRYLAVETPYGVRAGEPAINQIKLTEFDIRPPASVPMPQPQRPGPGKQP